MSKLIVNVAMGMWVMYVLLLLAVIRDMIINKITEVKEVALLMIYIIVPIILSTLIILTSSGVL